MVWSILQDFPSTLKFYNSVLAGMRAHGLGVSQGKRGWGWGKIAPGPEEHSQEPVHSYDQRDVFSGQADRCEHNDHGDQTCLGDASSPNAGCCRRDTVHEERTQGEGRRWEGEDEEESEKGHNRREEVVPWNILN